MSKKKNLDKRILVVVGRTFPVKEIVKKIKAEMGNQGFVFVEKEQSVKEDQYGRQLFFKFAGGEELDEFAELGMDVMLTFSNLQSVKVKGKIMDQGDIEILFIPTVTYDHKNDWATSNFMEFMFNFWIDYFKDDSFKKKYLKPSQKKVDAVYRAVKKLLDYYI